MDARVALDMTIKEFKLKASEIAEKAGMNQHELSRYRRGHSDVLASRAFQIIKALPTHRKFGSETPSFYDGFTVKYEHRLRNIC